MDANRFDAIARTLSDPASRRTLLGIVIGAVNGLGPLAGLAENNKNKNKASKKARKKRKRCLRECEGCCGGADGFRCEPGLYARACGKGGEECEDCSKSNLTCYDQRCCRYPGAECGFKEDCCDKSECRDQKCCITGRNDCEKDCPQNGPCAECCSGTCTDGHCCIAVGEACTSGDDDDCCGEESLCIAKICRLRGCDPPCGGGTHFCCANASDGRQDVCLFSDRMNCPIPGSQFVANCPREISDMCCVGPDDTWQCPGDPPGCSPDETQVPEITCLD